MFAWAVPKLFLNSAGTEVIFLIIGYTYSSKLLSFHNHDAQAVRGDVRHLDQAAVAGGKIVSRVAAGTVFLPVLSSSASTESIPWMAAPTATASSGLTWSSSGTSLIS